MTTAPAIGVMFRREQPPERLAAYARKVEAATLDELWVVEDCFYIGGIERRPLEATGGLPSGSITTVA